MEQTGKAQSPPVSMSVCQRQPPSQRVTSPGLEMPSVSAVAMMLPGAAANTNFVEPSGDTPAADSSCSSGEEDLLTDQPIVCTDTPRSAAFLEEGPSQPRLKEYHPKKFGLEKTYRDFNSDWFNMWTSPHENVLAKHNG